MRHRWFEFSIAGSSALARVLEPGGEFPYVIATRILYQVGGPRREKHFESVKSRLTRRLHSLNGHTKSHSEKKLTKSK